MCTELGSGMALNMQRRRIQVWLDCGDPSLNDLKDVKERRYTHWPHEVHILDRKACVKLSEHTKHLIPFDVAHCE